MAGLSLPACVIAILDRAGRLAQHSRRSEPAEPIGRWAVQGEMPALAAVLKP
jgi:hypothetical protein